jgi:hypothetical protein
VEDGENLALTAEYQRHRSSQQGNVQRCSKPGRAITWEMAE